MIFKHLLTGGVSEVGSIRPVDDFKDMLTRRDVDLVDKGGIRILCMFMVIAVEGLKRRIIQLVNDSVKDTMYKKAYDCVVALREGEFSDDRKS